jgi:Cu(I)/Ag(I) efflux system membrane fusion protein/cobalt-zinc-cadmium efflux system membrane fusion protein
MSTLILLLATGTGIAAGTYWHAPILRLVGASAANSPSGQSHHDTGNAASPTTPSTQLWTCGMHPQVIQDHTGKCPICHMDLTPLDPSGSKPGAPGLMIDPAVVQNMGVRFADAIEGPLHHHVRAFAEILEFETGIVAVNARVSGTIRRLYADNEGMEISKGDPLFDLYSPDLTLAIEELIAARKFAQTADETAHATAQSLLDAATDRLVALDLTRQQVASFAELDAAPEVVTFLASSSGTLVDKDDTFTGAAISPGQLVLRLASRKTMWVQAAIREIDLPLVRVGQHAHIRVDALPGQSIEGDVIYINPRLNEMTRTATVRVQVSNADASLSQGMYAMLAIDVAKDGPVVLVPREAVIETGDTTLVFLSDQGGRLVPRPVTVGATATDGLIEIRSGLMPGDRVVASGQFLLDSESRWREAIAKFLQPSTTPDRPAAAPTPTMHADPAKVDALVLAYLPLAEVLGAEQSADTPINVNALAAAILSLSQTLDDPDARHLADALSNAAQALKDQPLDAQRPLFKPLSAAIIALLDAMPPSKAVGESLYVVHCPMVKADWLQRNQEVANPYYAQEMKACGTVVRPIRAKGGN